MVDRMKRVLVINPNTSSDMTRSIKRSVTNLSNDIEITVVNPSNGPESLESFYDYQISAYEIIKLLQKRKTDYDGVLISCFGDPGLYAIKELLKCPVVGIAEASLSLSLLLGKKFSVIAALKKSVPMMEDMICQYGLSIRCSGVDSVNMNVLEIEYDKNKTIDRFIQVGEECIKKGAEVIILGCASMIGLKEKMEESLNVPVIDPVEAGVRTLIMIIESGLYTSKAGLFMSPPKGIYKL